MIADKEASDITNESIRVQMNTKIEPRSILSTLLDYRFFLELNDYLICKKEKLVKVIQLKNRPFQQTLFEVNYYATRLRFSSIETFVVFIAGHILDVTSFINYYSVLNVTNKYI